MDGVQIPPAPLSVMTRGRTLDCLAISGISALGAENCNFTFTFSLVHLSSNNHNNLYSPVLANIIFPSYCPHFPHCFALSCPFVLFPCNVVSLCWCIFFYIFVPHSLIFHHIMILICCILIHQIFCSYFIFSAFLVFDSFCSVLPSVLVPFISLPVIFTMIA